MQRASCYIALQATALYFSPSQASGAVWSRCIRYWSLCQEFNIIFWKLLSIMLWSQKTLLLNIPQIAKRVAHYLACFTPGLKTLILLASSTTYRVFIITCLETQTLLQYWPTNDWILKWCFKLNLNYWQPILLLKYPAECYLLIWKWRNPMEGSFLCTMNNSRTKFYNKKRKYQKQQEHFFMRN